MLSWDALVFVAELILEFFLDLFACLLLRVYCMTISLHFSKQVYV